MDFVVLDTETTGLAPEKGCSLIEVAAVTIKDWQIQLKDTFSELIDPKQKIDGFITRLTGITDEMLLGKRILEHVLPDFMRFLGDKTMVIQNAQFDLRFLNHACQRCGIDRLQNPFIDTIHLSKALFKGKHNLDKIMERLGIEALERHRALGDAVATARVFLSLVDRIGHENLWRWVRLP